MSSAVACYGGWKDGYFNVTTGLPGGLHLQAYSTVFFKQQIPKMKDSRIQGVKCSSEKPLKRILKPGTRPEVMGLRRA